MRRNHDSQFKLLFSLPNVVRDLVLHFVPFDAMRNLDFTTLETVPSAFVGDDERQRASDIFWRIRFNSQWVYLYVLLEFQSKVDRTMALRIAEYIAMSYRQQAREIKGRKRASRMRLPPVLPIVIYNGGDRWTARRELSELVAPVGEDLLPFQLRHRHVVLDMRRYRRGKNIRITNLIDYICELEYPSNPQAVMDAIEDVVSLVKDNPELDRLITQYTCAVLATRSEDHLLLDKIQSMKEMPMAIAPGYQRWLDENSRESLQKGREQGREEGRKEGRKEGREQGRHEERQAIVRMLLEDRFGELSPEVTARINAGSEAEVMRWLRRLPRAETLAEALRLH